ncbi:MAG: glycosyltransferase family 4 protein [Rubrivivax sp.]
MTILFAGRFDRWQKGLDWLASAVDSSAADLQYIIQGRGSFAPQLEALAQRKPHGSVTLRPWGPISTSLQEADILIMTSRFEGFPLVAIEAIHAGVPVVATRQSGLGDVLPTSAQVEFGDTAALLGAINRMRDASARAACVAHSREQARRLLSNDVYAEAVCQAVQVLRKLGTESR